MKMDEIDSPINKSLLRLYQKVPNQKPGANRPSGATATPKIKQQPPGAVVVRLPWAGRIAIQVLRVV